MTTAVLPKQINVTLPPLHKGRDDNGGQEEVDKCPARFIICLCGRRWGKTTVGVHRCIRCALQNPGRVYWWVGPTYPVAQRGWKMLKRMLRQIPGVIIHEADRYITLPNESEIWAKSADNPDSLRGEKLAGVVFDEMAQIKEEAWTEAVRPSLTDLKGWALFIGTPKGKNWVYRLWQRAGVDKEWARFRKPTIDNPFIDVKEIEQARLEVSEALFKQEYEADFGASQLLVYPDFDRHINMWRYGVPEFREFLGGLDFGGDTIGSHKSAGCVAGIDKQDNMIFIAEFEQYGPGVGETQLNWIFEQNKKVRDLIKKAKWPVVNHDIRWKADKTQMWGIQLVRSMGVIISPTKGGKDSIDEGIELVHRRLKIRSDGRSRLFYMPYLTLLPAAFERYKYPDDGLSDDGYFKPRKPLPINDDLITTARYLVEGKDFGGYGDPQKLYNNQLPRIG